MFTHKGEVKTYARPQRRIGKLIEARETLGFTQAQLDACLPVGGVLMANSCASINVRVDSEVKSKAQDLFSSLGMDMSTAINIFLRQAIRKKGIPFELVSEPTSKRRNPPQFGCLKGKIHEADDHSWFEPLEEIKL